MNERFYIPVGKGPEIEGKACRFSLRRHDDRYLKEGFDIDIMSSDGERGIGVSMTRENVLAGISEFFNVDIVDRPEPVKPIQVGDEITEANLERAAKEGVVILDNQDDVWQYVNGNGWLVTGFDVRSIGNVRTFLPGKAIATGVFR